MNKIKHIFTAASLLIASSSVYATVTVDFKAMADGTPGESGYNTLMIDSSGNFTTSASNAFLNITGTNGGNSFAYLDAGNAGLGVCGAITATLQCNPGSDDNVSYHNGTPETLHFAFDTDVIINKIWFNNNHDGDRSLLGDYVAMGLDGSTNPFQLLNGGVSMDSSFVLNGFVGANSVFDVGFYQDQSCKSGGTGAFNLNNCEFYISKIEYSVVPTTVPEPAILALVGLGLFGMGVVRRKLK